MSDHVENTCPLTEVPCPYNWLGCSLKVGLAFHIKKNKLINFKKNKKQNYHPQFGIHDTSTISSASASVTSNSPSSDDVSTSLAEVSKWIALALYKLPGAYIRSGYLTDQGYFNSFRVGWGMEGDYCWNFMV